MNMQESARLAGEIEALLQTASRINEAKPRRYWYPLSLATYGAEEVLEALDSLCSFRTTMWEKTLKFERQFAQYLGCSDAVMVNSGSSADLLLSFYLTNPVCPVLKPGDEILMPVVTWPTQIWSAMMAGLRVRLVDVDPATLNISLPALEAAIGPKTRAIFLVHLMGNPCAMDRIVRLAADNDLVLLEDCCEALGAEWDGVKVGNFGLGSSFSFFFSHHITTMEGGMVACSTPAVADEMRILRAHGWLRNVDVDSRTPISSDIDPRYAFVNWGFNLRPTDVQAGFGLRQMEKLPAFNARRAALAERFFGFVDASRFLARPRVEAKAAPSWFALPMVVRDDAPFTRQELTAWLEEQGIETRPVVAGSLARHPVARVLTDLSVGSFPGADVVHQRGFYIGLSPMQSDDAMEKVVERFQQFFRRY